MAKERRRMHRFYDKKVAKEFLDSLNKYCKVLKTEEIGVDKNHNIFFRRKIEGITVQ
jgi:hypothetical protein